MNQLEDKAGDQIGTQADFNKFAGSNAQSVNHDPAEFDRMLTEKTEVASAMTAFEDAEREDALKDLAQYEANANAPQGIIEQGANVPSTPEQLAQAGPAPAEDQPLVRQ